VSRRTDVGGMEMGGMGMTDETSFRGTVRRRTRGLAVLALSVSLLVAVLVAGCDDSGRYRLAWSFSDGPVVDAADCSSRGVGQVQITVFRSGGGEQVGSQRVRCFPPQRLSMKLDPGTYDLQVEGIRFDGRSFLDPDTGGHLVMAWVRGVEVRSGETTDAQVQLLRPAKCLDGVDNDQDGLIDDMDPGCWKRDDKADILFDDQGRHMADPTHDDEQEPTR